MRDLYRDLRFTSDGKRFFDGLCNAVAFIAHMRSVNTMIIGCDFRERNDLGCFGIGTRDIDQTRGKPDRAVFHGFIDQLFHLLQFGRGGIAVGAAHDGFADIIMSDE